MVLLWSQYIAPHQSTNQNQFSMLPSQQVHTHSDNPNCNIIKKLPTGRLFAERNIAGKAPRLNTKQRPTDIRGRIYISLAQGCPRQLFKLKCLTNKANTTLASAALLMLLKGNDIIPLISKDTRPPPLTRFGILPKPLK